MRGLLLTPRDKSLLETLFDFGLMTTDQLNGRVFSGIRAATVLRRLRKLEKKGLITRSAGLSNAKLAWSITAKGGSLIGLPQGFGHVNRNTLEHDILVSEVRLRLEKMGACQGWKSGHELKREISPSKYESPVLPDGIALMPIGGGVKAVAIELELSAKAKGRYVHVLEEYADKKSISCVWYIVSHKSIAKVLMKAYQTRHFQSRSGDWVYWTPLSEIFGDPFQIQFRSKTKTLYLKELMPLKVPTVPPENDPAQGHAQTMSTLEVSAKNTSSTNSLNEKEMSEANPIANSAL